MIGLRVNLSDKIFLTENKLLVIADRYLHINMKLLKETFEEYGFTFDYNYAYKGKDGLMKYEFNLRKYGCL